MDQTLVQLLNHIYDLENEKRLLIEFIVKNGPVLKAANVSMPFDVPSAPPSSE